MRSIRQAIAVALAALLFCTFGFAQIEDAAPDGAVPDGAAPDGAVPDRAAVAAYRAGDLASAEALWLELLEAEPRVLESRERGRLLYNLGNVAARESNWIEAVAWYTAALRLRPRDPDLWANLELMRTRAELEPADHGDLIDWLRRLLSSLSPGEGRWLALFGLLPLALALIYEALRGGAVRRRCVWSGLLIALVLASPFFYSSATGDAEEWMAICAGPEPVRSEPRSKSVAIDNLAPGQLIERLDELPGWVKVRCADGTEGWTAARNVFDLVR